MSATADTQVLIHAPREALRPFVKRFLVVESTAPRQDAHLPDTGVVAAFRFRGECWLYGESEAPRSALTGLWDTTRRHAHSRDHAVVIVAFTATGAASLVRQPIEDLANATIALDDLPGRPAGLDRLHEQLAAAPDHAQRIRLVEDLLLAQIGDARPDPLVVAAVASIERTRATLRIEALARHMGLSQSALERRFRRVVGVSPRRFASLVRLQHVLRLGGAGADLTTIAHAAGYCDQPHFIKDFKRFAGVTPGSFFARDAAAG